MNTYVIFLCWLFDSYNLIQEVLSKNYFAVYFIRKFASTQILEEILYVVGDSVK
jgi:hypothetical protein